MDPGMLMIVDKNWNVKKENINDLDQPMILIEYLT